MALSSDYLNCEINSILKDADLQSMSSKKVRLQLEEKLNCDLIGRKKEIDDLVMSCINQEEEDGSEDEEEEGDGDSGSDYSEEEKPKRVSTAKKTPAKKKRKYDDSDEDEDSADSDSGSDYKPSGPAKKGGGKKKAKKGSDDDDDSDDDYKLPKKAKAKKAAGGGGAKGKGNGYTRPLKLSPELAELMGTDALPRHEVVKKMWELIKGRNLYDPKNKQFAICDEDLLKVIGVKRFRTFGMLKYLKSHFVAE